MSAVTDFINNLSNTGLEWYHAVHPEKTPAPPTPPPNPPIYDPANQNFGLLVIAGVVIVVGLLLWFVLR